MMNQANSRDATGRTRAPETTAGPASQAVPDVLRVLVTLAMVAVACAALLWALHSQRTHPWTRDGQVLALVVGVAPQVEGPVTKVHIEDNQHVESGALLFELDPRLYRQAVELATANLAQALAEAKSANADAARAAELQQKGDLSDEDYDLKITASESAKAAVAAARARLETAQLKLQLTRVTAPVNGYVTNLTLDTGHYAKAGVAQVALVDSDSYWVTGYFKETDLAEIPVGAPATVVLMGHRDRPLHAEVESIAHGIARRNLGAESGGLANVSPTFEWIRLAQRIPVRIRLLERPKDLRLRIGTTASVAIHPPSDPTKHALRP